MHKIVSYVFYILIFVLVITHAPGFAADVTAVGDQGDDWTKLVTGQSTATSKG